MQTIFRTYQNSTFQSTLTSQKSVSNLRSGYIYGYQGSEKDNEIKTGDGNSYTTFYRMLDPRIGRWFSIDPKESSLPWQSPYCSMDNNPIKYNDVLGDRVINTEKGKSRGELRRMIREARKQDPDFDAWYKSKKRDGNDNYISLSGINKNSGLHPTNFTSPKYISGDKNDGTSPSPGTIITIGAGGSETGGTSFGDQSGHYYFARLSKTRTKTDNSTVGNPIVLAMGSLVIINGLHYDKKTKSYVGEIKLKEQQFSFRNGYINPLDLGLQIVSFNISDKDGTPIVNFTAMDNSNSGSMGSEYLAPAGLFVSNSKHIIVRVAVMGTNVRPQTNWNVNVTTNTSKTTNSWGMSLFRMFRRETLNNL